MANPVCTRASLAEALPGFGLVGLNRRQYEAATIYYMVLELAAIGGTNYAATMNTTLIDDAKQLVATMNRDQRQIALMNIARNRAVTAGATVPADINALQAATACCFQSYSDLESVMILLLCRLGVHKAYVQ